MKILTTLTAISGLAFLTLNASAQQSSSATAPAPGTAQAVGTAQLTSASPTQRPDAAAKMTDKIKSMVTGITPDQESQIYAIENDYINQVRQVQQTSAGGQTSTMHDKVIPLRQARDAKIKNILTAAQYAQYQATFQPRTASDGTVPVTAPVTAPATTPVTTPAGSAK